MVFKSCACYAINFILISNISYIYRVSLRPNKWVVFHVHHVFIVGLILSWYLINISYWLKNIGKVKNFVFLDEKTRLPIQASLSLSLSLSLESFMNQDSNSHMFLLNSSLLFLVRVLNWSFHFAHLFIFYYFLQCKCLTLLF